MNRSLRSAPNEALTPTSSLHADVSRVGRAARTRSHMPLACLWVAIVATCSFALPGVSFAGTGGTEFNSAYTTLTDWLQGDLGRLIAAALLVVGLVMGVVRQSIMAAVPAIACGLVATVAPTIIGAVVTAVI